MNDKARNIIITTVNPYMRKDKYGFFFYEDEYGESKYCGSASDQEAGTKLILSKNSIDEVIIIGQNSCVKDGTTVDRISLKEEYSFYKSNVEELYSFDMFAYRLAQYLDNTDLELFALEEAFYASDDIEHKELINNVYKEIKKRFPEAEKSKLFHYLRLSEGSEEIPILASKNKKIITQIFSVTYQYLDSFYKMRPLLCNNDLLISFIPADFTSDSKNLIKELIKRFEEIVNSEKYDEINVFLDTQGLNQAESLTVLYVMMMLTNKNSIINIKSFITANPNHEFMIRKIYDSISTLDLNYMQTGISDFIEYGKVDNIVKYWNKSKHGNQFINSFVNAMKTIDMGISLCNFYELEKGIKKIKELFKTKTLDDDLPFLQGIFVLLIYGIKKDYGDLINNDSDEIDIFEVIKWAYKKKYYQQAITFAESQIPDDIVKRGIWYYAKDKKDKEKVLNILADLYNLSPPNQRYAFEEISHYLVKIEGRTKLKKTKDNYERQFLYAKYKTSLLEDDPKNGYKAYSVIEDKEIIEDALSAYYVLSTKRNLINHAQKLFSIDSEMEKEGECAIWDEIEKTLSYFISKYQVAVDTVKDKEFVSCSITYQELMDVVNKEKKDNLNKDVNRNSYNKKFIHKPCRYCIVDSNGRKYNYNNLEEWITRFEDKHPELMEESVEIVKEKLIETRDKFMKENITTTYKGYRLLPTVFDSK